MAEAVAVLTTANAAFKLALTLFEFAEAVGSVDKEISRTAREISSFSAVLNYLGATLERGQDAKYITKSAFESVQKVTDECREIFQELEAIIEKSTTSEEVIKMEKHETVPKIGSKLSVSMTKRLLFLFQRSKFEALRIRLESWKSLLSLLLETLAIADRFEAMRKSNTQVRPDSEAAKARRAQDSLNMECLVLANEAAAAEVRKYTKTKAKIVKAKNEDVEAELKSGSSIASEGVLGELQKRSPPTNLGTPTSEAGDKSTSHQYSLAPVLYSPAAAAQRDLDESKIKVQETNQIVLALFALWVSNGAQSALSNDQPKTAAGMNAKQNYEEKRRADEEEELVDLFPKRESRPY